MGVAGGKKAESDDENEIPETREMASGVPGSGIRLWAEAGTEGEGRSIRNQGGGLKSLRFCHYGDMEGNMAITFMGRRVSLGDSRLPRIFPIPRDLSKWKARSWVFNVTGFNPVPQHRDGSDSSRQRAHGSMKRQRQLALSVNGVFSGVGKAYDSHRWDH